MQPIDDGCCFICGKDNPIGLKAVFNKDTEKRRAETVVTIPERFQGWQGVTHGGIIAALLDEVCAQACMGMGITVVTSEMKLRYRLPVPSGSVVTVTGEIVGERRRLIDVSGKVLLDGQVVAEAEIVMYRT